MSDLFFTHCFTKERPKKGPSTHSAENFPDLLAISSRNYGICLAFAELSFIYLSFIVIYLLYLQDGMTFSNFKIYLLVCILLILIYKSYEYISHVWHLYLRTKAYSPLQMHITSRRVCLCT